MSKLALVIVLVDAAHGLSQSRFSRRAVAGVAAAALMTRSDVVHANDSEIEVTVLSPGDPGSPTPQRAQKVVVDYTLWIDSFDGKQIDTSKGTLFPPRPPAPFIFNVGVGEVIPGWDRTVKTMHVGEKRRVKIPAALGYGAKGVGPIPGGADLYFEIELLELKPPKVLSDKQVAWLAEHPEP